MSEDTGGGLQAGMTTKSFWQGCRTSDWRADLAACLIRCRRHLANGSRARAATGGATKAAYRFFDNARVTEHGMLAGRFASNAMRCAEYRSGEDRLARFDGG
ncbi:MULTISPECIES: hypothetical protein [unclassified Bradyrhizobium]|uniref:hypothetical protein n=1 Tax=unclassified Bradyrhizobium TaxID=2631580 RepID=UPI0023EE3DC5|nr:MULTISPECIES: hypothetical protein [unclassified Bradyrhizobium]